MKKSNFNTRKCLVCKKHHKKAKLFRFYVNNNIIELDNNICKGRGYYVCKQPKEVKILLGNILKYKLKSATISESLINVYLREEKM